MQRSQLAEKQRGEGLGSLTAAARALQARGTDGDTVLAHINPEEAQLLDKLADGVIDGGGRNPSTGLPSFGMSDGESGRSDGDANAGGVGGGPTGGQTGGGLGGNTEGGLGGLGGGYGGAGEDDRGAPSSGANVMGDPEMGGGLARSRGLASVAALGPVGRNVNAASAAMAGRGVSFSDRVSDAFGQGAPGGFLGSPAATTGIGLLGTAIGGPALGTAMSLGHQIGLGGYTVGQAAPSAIGGLVGGLPGSLVGHQIGNAITGREDYDDPMSQADRDAKDKQSIESARTGTTAPGSEPGKTDGSGAGTDYVMAPPAAAAAPAPAAAQAASATPDGWDEGGFLNRHPEVAGAVKNGTWTTGYAFNEAYRKTAGASYDAAKAIGVVSPYNDETLKTRPGQAVAWRA